MASPQAVIFALALAVWVADAGFTRAHAHHQSEGRAPGCQEGVSTTPPDGSDLEIVTCGTRAELPHG
jgi:hypothetical protein